MSKNKQIFGYVILHKETKAFFTTGRGAYLSKAAAVQAFNRVTCKGYWSTDYDDKVKGVAFKDQDVFGVYPLVAHYE